jgi:hypothetical protein
MSGPQISGFHVTVGGTRPMCDPVCQLFINGYGKQSTYTLLNFPSLYSPSEAQPCTYKVTLFDEGGTAVRQGTVTVPAFGSAAFKPRDAFAGPLPELGLFTAELVDWAEPAYEQLGLLRPYFYAIYYDDTMGSVSVVHPQTTLMQTAPAGVAWRSSLVISAREVVALEVFQVNPMPDARITSVAVTGLDGQTKAASAAQMPGRSVRRIYWPAADFDGSDYVCIASDAMTAPNAKPLLFQHRSGGFSAGHS